MLGDSLERLRELEVNSVDAVVCDPPYGLVFMGKKWDAQVPSVELWREVFRVMKPGAHLLSFGGTRTYHRMVVAIEDAGFEIRDQVMWIYGSGFPKSQDVSKAIDKQAGAEREVIGSRPLTGNGKTMKGGNFHQAETEADKIEKQAVFNFTAPATDDAKRWQGWGTALKPANEPIVLARKPLEPKLTVAANVLKHGTGAINVDASRIVTSDSLAGGRYADLPDLPDGNAYGAGINKRSKNEFVQPHGRWPANVIFNEQAAAVLDEQSGVLVSKWGKQSQDSTSADSLFGVADGAKDRTNKFTGDSGGASRFFYVAKSSKSERNKGLDKTELVWENDAWEKQGLKSDLADTFALLKDISDDTLTDACSWSIEQFGLKLTDQCPTATIFTIKTALSLITDLKTSNASQSSITSASIQDAIRMIEVSGLSLAESAALTSQSKQNTTNEKTASVLGVVHALLQTLSQIRSYAKSGNFHSTIKPIKLMEYLVRMITPSGGVCLDPFMGSGSTGVAAVRLGFRFIGCEMSPEYLEIARKRIEHAQKERAEQLPLEGAANG